MSGLFSYNILDNPKYQAMFKYDPAEDEAGEHGNKSTYVRNLLETYFTHND
jgi:hypothetical protein